MQSFIKYESLVGCSTIEKLPSELLYNILLSASSSHSPRPDSISRHLAGNVNSRPTISPCLIACLLTSRTLLGAGLPVMYRNVKISKFSTMVQVLGQIRKYPALGMSVRSFDFSDYCFSTEPPNETSNSLLELLTRTPLVRDFRINKRMESYFTHEVIQKLFYNLQYLEFLDLSSCDSMMFTEACSEAIYGERRLTASLRSLSLAGCTSLPQYFFDSLLSQLPLLQYLDVSNTQITTAALFRIHVTARLSHLNISHCRTLDGSSIVDFLTRHPSTKEVEYLNIEMDPQTENTILDEQDISELLANLPPSLKILNLKNSAMTSAHLHPPKTLLMQLEGFCLGCDLRFADIEKLFFDPQIVENEEQHPDDSQGEGTEEVESKYQTVLSPMEEAIAVCKLRQQIDSASVTHSPGLKPASLRYLDISSLPVAEQGKIRTSKLLGPQSTPLEIIEISEMAARKFVILPKLCAAVGWELKNAGRRCWIRRKALQ